MTQSIRNTAKVTMPATIWFLVRLEMNRPSEMKQPPSSSRPRYAVTSGFHSGRAVDEQIADVDQRDRQHHARRAPARRGTCP